MALFIFAFYLYDTYLGRILFSGLIYLYFVISTNPTNSFLSNFELPYVFLLLDAPYAYLLCHPFYIK